MVVRSTFSGFLTARSGLVASQASLDVTAQNMTNINTSGYTRQRANLNSVGSTATNMRYADYNGIKIGYGVNVSSIGQLRDSSLDQRFRAENQKYAYNDVKLSGLQELESIFDETTTDGLNAQLDELLASFQDFSTDAASPQQATIVQNQALTLTKLLNQYASDLESLTTQQISDFQVAFQTVQDTINELAYLNELIYKENMVGQPALELNDQRNLLLDNLSGYLNIDYSYAKDPITGVDKLSVNLKLDSPVTVIDNDGNSTEITSIPLVNHKSASNVSLNYDPANPSEMTVNITDLNGNDHALSSSEINSGAFGGYLTVLTADGTSNGERGIPFYTEALNAFTVQFADVMNQINRELLNSNFDITTADSSVTDKIASGEYLFVESDNDPNTGSLYAVKDLFTSSDGQTLSAANITISQAWQTNASYITATQTKDADGNAIAGANDNLTRFISAFKADYKFTNATAGALGGEFNGTFQQMTGNISTTISLDVAHTDTMYTSYSKVVNNLEQDRLAVSSVSEEEEGVNMLTYQKSYNAASRLMTTIDEMLDKLINGTGRVGL